VVVNGQKGAGEGYGVERGEARELDQERMGEKRRKETIKKWEKGWREVGAIKGIIGRRIHRESFRTEGTRAGL
jgi:hypothetical protein